MAKRVSIKDIAEEVGVSTALVSYVLNGKEKQARIGQEMVKKVKTVAARLNYQPNLIARGLKFGKTKTLGLIVADISNPFFSSLARIIENEAKKHGYTVIFGSSDEQLEKSQVLIDTLLNRQVDGLIIAPVEGSQEQIARIRNSNVPVVLIDRGLDELPTHRVTIDNYQSVFKAVKLLVKNGYQRIGMMAYDSNLTHMQDRVRGYRDALKAEGLPAGSKLLVRLSYEHSAADISSALEALIRQKKIDAIVLATNSISLHALRAINNLGIQVPTELGVVCFDESDVYDFFYTPITYIKQDLKTIGETAVEIMIRDIDNPQPHKLIDKVVKSKMMIGASSRGNQAVKSRSLKG
ncbi:LacI family DNA-binding transcriptional regulator [Niabella terrae]